MHRALAWCLFLGLSAEPAVAQRLVRSAEVVRGTLSDADARLPSGARYDEYRFARRGRRERLVIRFLSADFHPRIIVRGPRGEEVEDSAESDPDEQRDFQVFLEELGVYRIIVAGDSAAARGGYAVRMSLEQPEGPPPPPPPPPPRPPPVPSVERLDSVPMASRATNITAPCLANRSLTYGQIYDRLERVLTSRQYPLGWFLTSSGFAVTTSFERITDAGATIFQDRFNTAPFFNSAWQVLTHQTTPGRYRAFVIAYGTGLRQQTTPLGMPRIEAWVESRGFALPQEVRRLRGGPNHYLQIFIYEYHRPSTNARASLVQSPLQAQDHLAESRLGPALRAICGG